MHSPQRLTTPLLWTSLYCLISPATADTGCFNPNGTNRNVGAPDVPSGTSVYAPCNTVQPYSMCCRNSDKCLPNGLCQQSGSDIIWRESCSDQSWRSNTCVKLCVSDTGSDHQVHQCPDQSWCCSGGSSNATACCEQGLGSWLGVDGQVTNVNPNSTSTSTTSSSSSSTQTTAPNRISSSSPAAGAATSPAGAQAPPATYNGGGTSHIGAIVGGVLGGVVALAVLAAGAWWLLRRRKRKGGREGEGMRPQVPPMGYHEAGAGAAEERVPYQYQMEKGGVHEVMGDGLWREELDVSGARSELNGSSLKR